MLATNVAETRFAALILSLVIVLVLGRLTAIACRRVKQPVVIGEILVGIALGPSLLGLLPGDLDELLFPLDVRPYLKLVASLGLVLFMFIVGLEVDLDVVRRSGRRAVAISLTSIALPFLLGFGLLGSLLHDDSSCVAVPVAEIERPEGEPPVDQFGGECTSEEVRAKQADLTERIDDATADREEAPSQVAGRRVPFAPLAMFIGVSMCGTAFAVLARILAERNMFRIPLGLLLIACAAIDDIVAFSLLALSTAVAGEGSTAHVLLMLGQLLVFTTVLFTVVRPLLARLVIEPYRRTGRLGPEQFSIILVGLLLSSYVTSKIGVHELIGAFLFGVAVPRRTAASLPTVIAERLEGVSVQLLLPVFFVIAGQGVVLDQFRVSDIGPTVAILLVACVGKFAGGAVAARLTGVPKRQALAVGTLMNTRGLAELVILQVGRDAGVINDRVYTMLVIMAVVTTAMAGPLLRLVYPDRWLQRDIADADRKRTGNTTDRVAVVVDDPATAAASVELAAAYGGGRATGLVTLIWLKPDRVGRGATLATVADDLADLSRLHDAVDAAGLRCDVISRAAADVAAETVAEVERLAPGAVILPDACADLTPALRSAGVDVIRPGPAPTPPDAIAVVGGTGNAPFAALELATRLALYHGVALHIDGGVPRRARAALELLGVDVRTNGDGAEGALVTTDPAGPAIERGRFVTATVQPGDRDRAPMTESLAAWVGVESVVPLSER